MSGGTPLQVLGLQDGNYSSADVRRAYHRLALLHHPDKAGSLEVFKRPPANAAARRFSQIFKKNRIFRKIGQNRFLNFAWADLGLKFGFSVKNRSYSWAQTIISSFFEIQLF